MIRALGEFEIEGVRTTIPAHLALLDTPEFRAVTHSTKWVEDEVDQARFAASRPSSRAAVTIPAPEGADDALVERTVPVEVDGRRYTVKVWLPDAPARRTRGRRARPPRSRARRRTAARDAATAR